MFRIYGFTLGPLLIFLSALGIWYLIFPIANPLLGGFAGIVGIMVWLSLGLWEIQRHKLQ